MLTVSADVYRPAAIEQLKTVTRAGRRRVVRRPRRSRQPHDIALAALDHAKRHYFDVLLVDTAGRLAIDEALMAEIRELHAVLKPIETLFVVDAMQGQDAVNTAKAFKDALPLTGVVLTKLDGDSRGGAALSVRQVTGAPIKFAGMSEKIDGLEVFDAERHAGRVLGMGDIVALVEEVQKGVDVEAAQKLADKVKSGGGFDLNDFLAQILADEEDGRPGRPDGQAAQPAQRQGRPAPTWTAPSATSAHGRHHLLDDAAGAAQARAHQGQPQAPHRRRRRRAGAGRQPPAQPVRADAGHDEEDEGRRPDEDDEAHGRHGAASALSPAASAADSAARLCAAVGVRGRIVTRLRRSRNALVRLSPLPIDAADGA